MLTMWDNSAGEVNSFLPASGFECLLMQYVLFPIPTSPLRLVIDDMC